MATFRHEENSIHPKVLGGTMQTKVKPSEISEWLADFDFSDEWVLEAQANIGLQRYLAKKINQAKEAKQRVTKNLIFDMIGLWLAR
jgi:hypothetical protein